MLNINKLDKHTFNWLMDCEIRARKKKINKKDAKKYLTWLINQSKDDPYTLQYIANSSLYHDYAYLLDSGTSLIINDYT